MSGEERGHDRERAEAPVLFISYDTADKPHATDLRRLLTEHGYRVWMAPEDIRGSTPWPEQILKGIDGAALLVVLISSGSNQSSHVAREVSIAVDHGKPVLPIRIEEVAISGTLQYLLGLVQWVDAFPPLPKHSDRLMALIADLFADGARPSEEGNREVIPLLRHTGHRNNLPVGLPALLGREQELLTLAEFLHNHRCVTVVGPGGVGKTRIALEAATTLQDDYPGGVWVAHLAELSEQSDLAGSIADALGLPPTNDRSDMERLIEVIGSRSTLILLDNCEHVLGPVSSIAMEFRNRCPGMGILATSRERLHISGEQVLNLGPLEVAQTVDAADLMRSPAVQLLMARAREAGVPDSSLKDASLALSICQRLEGIPLAIELAAARLRTLSASDLDASLAKGLRALSSRHTTGPAHHATMSATIDWSRGQLDEAAQGFFSRLGVLVGGFDLAACQAIGRLSEEEEAIDLVGELVEASLVVQVPSATSSRYRMLEPIRQYAVAELQRLGAESDARSDHAAHFLRLAQAAEPYLYGRGQAEWCARLRLDEENLQSALGWLVDHDRTKLLEMVAALSEYWFFRGAFREGARWLEAALAHGLENHPRRIDALSGLAQLACFGGEYGRGQVAAEEAVRLSEAEGERGRAVVAKENLARIMLFTNQEEAIELLEVVRAEAKSLGMTRWEADANHFLGILARRRGDPNQALLLHREAKAGFSAAEDSHGVLWSTGAEAVDLWALGLLEEARVTNAHATRLAADLGDTRAVAAGTSMRALLELDAGEIDLAYLYAIASVRASWEIGAKWELAAGLIVLARIEAVRGNSEKSATFVGASEGVHSQSSVLLPGFGGESLVEDLKQRLGNAFAAAVDRGKGLGWEGIRALFESDAERELDTNWD